MKRDAKRLTIVARYAAPVLALLCSAAHPAPTPARLMAGAGRVEIAIPPATLPLDGFTVVHDPLHARVVLLDSGGQRVAIAVVDLTSITADAVAEMQANVAGTTGVGPANVWIVASHGFSAPHMFGAHAPPGVTMTADEQRRALAYRGAVLDAVARAAALAKAGLQPARIGIGTGVASVNVNRNRQSADGWWLGADDTGPSDKSVAVLRIEGLDHQPIALLVNYAVQSSVMDHSLGADGGKGITADLGGAAMRHVEHQYANGAVSLFLTGAAADQAPAFAARRNVYDKVGHYRQIDLGDAGYPLVDLQGERLGTEAVRVSQRVSADQDLPKLMATQGSVELTSQERPHDLQQIHPTKSYAYKAGRTTELPYFLLQIGDIAIVGCQVELTAATGEQIKRLSPFPNTLVVTMVNGAAKYLPDSENYRKMTYEAMNSSYAPGSAEQLEAQILRDLRALRHDAAK